LFSWGNQACIRLVELPQPADGGADFDWLIFAIYKKIKSPRIVE